MINRNRFLGLICSLSVHPIAPVIMRVDTEMIGEDKIVAYLSDDHVRVPEEEEQLHAIIDSLHQREKNNSSTHFLIEQPIWLADIFGCSSQILFRLSKYIEQATPKLTLTTVENLEIRHLAGAVYNMLLFPVPYQLNPYREQNIDSMEKTLGSITFQDVLNDFTQIKQVLASCFLQQDNSIMSNIYAKHINRADSYYEKFLQQMKKDDIPLDTLVLKYAKKNSLEKTEPLATSIFDTFVPLFDLHTVHKIVTSEHKNIVVVAGGFHTLSASQALDNFNNVTSLYSAGKSISIDYQNPITRAQLQQSLSMQKKSLMSRYAPTVIKSSLTIALCYLLCLTIMQTIGRP